MEKQDEGGMKIRAAAKKIGIAPSCLSEILQGKRPNLRKELVNKN
jgi:plasmid maintenance system antidote protein VapI